MNMMSTQNFSKFGTNENRRRFTRVKDNLDFDEFIAEMGVAPIGDFLDSSGIWCNSSIMFYEFILSNNSSFETQNYLGDSYIPIFASMYTLKL